MTGDVAARCLQCGLEIDREGNDWVCRGCNIRVDRHGRRTKKQWTPKERAARTLAQPRLFDDAPRRVPDEVGRPIANFDDPPPTRFTARPRKRRKLWCRPCDRLFVMRNRKPTCYACGVIYDPKVA